MWAVSGQFSRPVAPRQHRLGRKGREGSPSPSAERQAPAPPAGAWDCHGGGGGGPRRAAGRRWVGTWLAGKLGRAASSSGRGGVARGGRKRLSPVWVPPSPDPICLMRHSFLFQAALLSGRSEPLASRPSLPSQLCGRVVRQGWAGGWSQRPGDPAQSHSPSQPAVSEGPEWGRDSRLSPGPEQVLGVHLPSPSWTHTESAWGASW